MARRTIFLGSPLSSVVDTRGPARPTWPDVGTDGVQLDAGVAAQLGDAVAIALAAETDWDLVRVYFAGVDQPELLLPGRVLFIPQGMRIARMEPLFPPLATRLYAAGGISKGVTSPTSLPPGINVTGDGTAHSMIHNSGAADLSAAISRWTGQAWASDGALQFTAGGDLMDGASNWVFLDAAGTAGNTARPADYSFDGGIFTIADYIEAGLIPGLTPGVARVSKFANDAHGNAGDGTVGTTKRYAQFFQGSKLSSYGKLSPLFFGRLALDVFDKMPVMEPGGSPYRPRLAPARYVTLPRVIVAGTFGAPAFPDQALLTFPVVNARRVELLLRSEAGSGDLYVALVSPAIGDSIAGVAGVPDAEAPPAAQYLTVSAGNEGSLVLDTPSHPYCKIVVGSNGGATIAAGAVLTVKRDVIE